MGVIGSEWKWLWIFTIWGFVVRFDVGLSSLGYRHSSCASRAVSSFWYDGFCCILIELYRESTLYICNLSLSRIITNK